MSKTMQINPPEGFKFQSVDQTSGAINLVEIPKSIMERIKTFEDVCKEMGKDPKDYICKSEDPDDIVDNASNQKALICRCFNRSTGKVIDWANSDQRKYYHVYVFSPSSGWSLNHVDYWLTVTLCGSRHTFLDDEHALYVWETFKKYVLTQLNKQQNGINNRHN